MSVNQFGIKSLQRLSECHENLQLIMNELIKEMDVSILCGHRTKVEQDRAFLQGNSQLKWPESKHNKTPSLACDVVPYPCDWQDIKKFNLMCDRIESIASRLNIKIRLGRDFTFKDMPHVELI